MKRILQSCIKTAVLTKVSDKYVDAIYYYLLIKPRFFGRKAPIVMPRPSLPGVRFQNDPRRIAI